MTIFRHPFPQVTIFHCFTSRSPLPNVTGQAATNYFWEFKYRGNHWWVIKKKAKHNKTRHNVQISYHLYLLIFDFPCLFKKFFHIWYQAWPINDILSHEYFLIFRDGIFNGDLICLIWMVLYVSKMKFQQFFGFTDLFETRVWTYFLSNVHRFWGTVKIIRQFHTFLICSQLLQCKTLVKSADCFMFNLFLL